MTGTYWRRTLALTLVALAATCASATGDQESQPSLPAAGYISLGQHHSCAVRLGAVRCWGWGKNGQLGYGNIADIGDDEKPAAAGPVSLGAGRTADEVSA